LGDSVKSLPEGLLSQSTPDVSINPEWILPTDKDEWINRGVIIWDSEAKRVISLSPHQALDVLDDLRESTSWKSEPFILSWDSYSFPFSEDHRKELRLSTNRRNILDESNLQAGKTSYLVPNQTLELNTFLELHFNQLREMADEDSKNVRKLLGKAYRLILSWPRENQQSSK
jgi:hypothetical protein